MVRSRTASREWSITWRRVSASGERLANGGLELIVGRLRQLVERLHSLHDLARRVDHEEGPVVHASANRAVLRQFEEFVASFQVVDKMEAQRQVALPGGGAQGAYPGMSAIGMAAALGRPIAPNSLAPIVR